MTIRPNSPLHETALPRGAISAPSRSNRNQRPGRTRLYNFGLLNLGLLLAFSSPMEQGGCQAVSAANAQAPRPWGQNPEGMHIYLWAGLKSHFPGQHDYPQFLADWSKLLTEHGAVVDGAFHAPSAADLEHADVVIIYKGDAGYLSDEEKAALEGYVNRGGGLAS